MAYSLQPEKTTEQVGGLAGEAHRESPHPRPITPDSRSRLSQHQRAGGRAGPLGRCGSTPTLANDSARTPPYLCASRCGSRARMRGNDNGSGAARTLRQALQFGSVPRDPARAGYSVAALLHRSPCACLHVASQLVRYEKSRGAPSSTDEVQEWRMARCAETRHGDGG
jgi:hypothetical protein